MAFFSALLTADLDALWILLQEHFLPSGLLRSLDAKLGYLTVRAAYMLTQKNTFAASNDVPSLGIINYDAEHKTLYLGALVTFTKDNINQYNV